MAPTPPASTPSKATPPCPRASWARASSPSTPTRQRATPPWCHSCESPRGRKVSRAGIPRYSGGMKAAAVGFALALLSSGTPAQAAPPTRPDLAAQLDAELVAHFPADQPGAAVLIRKGSQIILRKGYGAADLAHH